MEVTNLVTNEEIITLHSKRLNDRQIGDLLRRSQSGICRRRIKLGLIANVHPRLINKLEFDLSIQKTKEIQEKFNRLDKRIKYVKRYNNSDQGKANRIKYKHSDKYKKYIKSDSYKENKRKYEHSEKYKKIKRECDKRYHQTEKYKEYQKKYREKIKSSHRHKSGKGGE